MLIPVLLSRPKFKTVSLLNMLDYCWCLASDQRFSLDLDPVLCVCVCVFVLIWVNYINTHVVSLSQTWNICATKATEKRFVCDAAAAALLLPLHSATFCHLSASTSPACPTLCWSELHCFFSCSSPPLLVHVAGSPLGLLKGQRSPEWRTGCTLCLSSVKCCLLYADTGMAHNTTRPDPVSDSQLLPHF